MATAILERAERLVDALLGEQGAIALLFYAETACSLCLPELGYLAGSACGVAGAQIFAAMAER